jgi:flavodoxin
VERRDVFKLGLAGIGTMILSKPVHALEYFLATSQKKNAVFYYSWCLSTKDAAGWIAEGMGGTANVDVIDIKNNPNVNNYESIVIGSAVREMAIAPDVKTYVQTNKTALKNKLKGMFAVCGNNSSTTISDMTKKKYTIDANGIGGLCSVTNVPYMVFPGRVNQCTKDAGINLAFYDHLSQTDCVNFGKTILPTLVKPSQNEIPNSFELCQNHPNPFNPITMITYSLPKTSNVLLTICAPNGQKISTLVSGLQAAGNYKVKWDGTHLAPGYYLYRLEAGGYTATRPARRVGQ